MTRKRKIIEPEAEEAPKSTFPKKRDWRGEEAGNYYQEASDGNKFGNYGYQSTEQTYEKREEEGPRVEFPKDLVTYLRTFIDLQNSEGKLDDLAWERIHEEVKGSEELLLKFFDSCKIVENLFGSNSKGATNFLTALFRIKHKKLLDLFFANSGARTIEKLLYASYPINNNKQIEILSILTELLCDNWRSCVTEQSSSFLIRCLVKVLSGTINNEKKSNFPNTAIGNKMSQMFCRIADLAIEQKDLLENQHCCLVFQEILHCDTAVQAGKCSRFVTRRLAEPDSLLNSFCGKSSSRIWDAAIKGCSEDIRSKLWKKMLKENLEKLSLDQIGNFPLQAFMKSVESEELAKEVCEAAVPLMPKLMEKRLGGVIVAIANCSRANEECQESVLKELRTLFKADKPEQKEHFFLNVLMMNKYDGSNCDVQQINGQGTYLIQALLELKKVKTLCSGILALKAEDIMKMAKHKLAAFVVQAIIKSQTITDDVKMHVIKAFEGKWVELIEDPIGSRTFEVIWDSPLTTVNTKQTLMKSFVAVKNISKGWKFAMMRCDMNLFRKDRKAWVKKMKEWPML